jgi:hypothetical protein
MLVIARIPGAALLLMLLLDLEDKMATDVGQNVQGFTGIYARKKSILVNTSVLDCQRESSVFGSNI